MNMSTPDNQILIANAQVEVLMPSSGSEARIGIRRSDWQRIKTDVSRLDKPIPKLEVIYAILFGIAGTSALSIPIAYSEKNPPNWLLSFYVDAFIVSLAIGIALVVIGTWVRKMKKQQVGDCVSNMQTIEDQFKERMR